MSPQSGGDTKVGKVTVLGIGNLIMGDEGVGVHVVRRLEEMCRLSSIDFVDGGTGGFHLLGYFTDSDLVVIIDATMDGQIPGTVRQLRPEFSSDYPPTLVSHDIGLKDMLDAVQLLDQKPEMVLFTLSISDLNQVSMDLSPKVQSAVQPAADKICAFLKTLK